MSEVKLGDLSKDKNLNAINKAFKLVVLDSLKAEYDKDNKTFLPDLNRGDIVECHFVGIGSEFDNKHFAVVWSAPANRDTILVIPLTSQPINEDNGQFLLGTIPNFYTSNSVATIKDSYVYINKITEVSRTRVGLWFKRDASLRFISNSKGNNIPVKITSKQIERINEGIRLLLLGEQNLLDIIKKEHVSWIVEVPTDRNILLHGNRLVSSYSILYLGQDISELEYEISEGVFKITLRKFDWTKFKGNRSLYNYIKFRPNVVEKRNDLLKSLFSKDINFVNESEQIINDIIIIS